MYEEVKRTGLLLPHGGFNRTRREHGGVLIHISRDGTPLRYGGGAHRFAIAYILDIEKAPAQLGVIHLDAAKSGVMKELRRPPSAYLQTGAVQSGEA